MTELSCNFRAKNLCRKILKWLTDEKVFGKSENFLFGCIRTVSSCNKSQCQCCLIFRKCLCIHFIWEAEKAEDRDNRRRRERDPPICYTPLNICCILSTCRARTSLPVNQKATQFFHIGGRDFKHNWLFSDTLQEAALEAEVRFILVHASTACGHPSWKHYLLCHNAQPCFFVNVQISMKATINTKSKQ